ncbi:PD-(D/E)XK motif protein [Solwaraspora sp. WMMD937]|uniref:PD-(D/E)XK motif protein n=1 Tax=Solwaraspora sp. WMMD937 TaxID=3016090 RepID=UPI002499D2A4|nr:PD-(D/E)XK motif protein [Solwaraspora sp. WMMD937]WFE23304.1 PD-(D/E)XK motif protein [Solwaraspora sp. WMMD937]
MTTVSEHYVMLESHAEQFGATSLLTRDVGVQVGGRDVLAAIDAAGQKHLLIPVLQPKFGTDYTSQGVTLGSRLLRVGGRSLMFADLHCRLTSLDLVFEHLVEDVVQRLADDGSSPVATCQVVLDEWRKLLQPASEGPSQQAVIGLIGELEVLRLMAAHDPLVSLDLWKGPTGTTHDFVRARRAIEVKTVTSADGLFVRVSNIDQLDPDALDSLHLIVVHLRQDQTAPSLVDRIDDVLALGTPRSLLLERIKMAGYLYGSPLRENQDRFFVRSVRAWVVEDSFPGLRRSELGEARLRGISRISYDLTLDSTPLHLTEEQFDRLLQEWTVNK